MNNELKPLPPLSPSLSLVYISLDDNDKELFIKVYKYLWNCVCPLSKFVNHAGLLHSFWCVDLLRDKYKLTDTTLSLLSFLYQVTNQGKNSVNTHLIYSGAVLSNVIESTKRRELNNLKRRGFILRPVASGSGLVCLSSAGINLIKQIEKDLYDILMRTSLNELTGQTNKNLN